MMKGYTVGDVEEEDSDSCYSDSDSLDIIKECKKLSMKSPLLPIST